MVTTYQKLKTRQAKNSGQLTDKFNTIHCDHTQESLTFLLPSVFTTQLTSKGCIPGVCELHAQNICRSYVRASDSSFPSVCKRGHSPTTSRPPRDPSTLVTNIFQTHQISKSTRKPCELHYPDPSSRKYSSFGQAWVSVIIVFDSYDLAGS